MDILSRLGLAGLLAAAALPAAAQTATGYQAGDILVHASILGVFPENFASGVTIPGYHVHVTSSVSPELDGSYFLDRDFSLELIAATTRHNVSVKDGGSVVKVGSTWVLPPTLTLQYHLPQIGPVRPYAGVGVTVAFFYDPQRAADVTKEGGFRTGVGPALDAGFDIPVTGNWVANFDVKQIFLVTGTHVDNHAVGAIDELSPTVVGVGVGYLF